ncbi:Type 1 glutamine amidotransferase-like domain-containing protein [Micromonospora sp. U21]|uniref:Type 1 glutamine amidotransferase-like domain-containing protein n=1 Tax=Micromonospora sp. U21 TaxID=2824899 RepID=UPI001B372AA0|nr:Type 1 glutamine amidotransferase-like domain-containing protein [Micromonospora sp. U21]MBQ0905444.1 Type 1 glutamine amidotransferase-like domain-containing protein [Micromonospora sp. U21]
MRLYLSSFRTGAHPDRLLALTGGRRTALIPNALDALPTGVRDNALRRDLDDLHELGLDVATVDLREPGAVARLAEHDIIWVRGGNVFVLRRVLADTGADSALLDLLHGDALVYGGYSAGACVLADDLSGLARVDDPAAVADPLTTGLGLLDRPFVPHVRSPGHPETSQCNAVSAAYDAAGEPHWALRDGEVLLVDGDRTELLH